ncbi:hypothetical protein F4808DRAFT_438616 [Astrocystis sublimbata]|nr:hypothetical protein F4808DRAFT_438616 [Astrocystis sublimbata]
MNRPITIKIPARGEVTHIGTWAELAGFLIVLHPDNNKDGREVTIDLTCGLCRDRHLMLPHWVDNKSLGMSDDEKEKLCVFPCGHFFGLDCVKNWVACNQAVRDGCDRCPMCRFPLRYTMCGHRVKFSIYDHTTQNPPGHLVPTKKQESKPDATSVGDGTVPAETASGSSDLEDRTFTWIPSPPLPGLCDDCHRTGLQRWKDYVQRARAHQEHLEEFGEIPDDYHHEDIEC